MRFTISGDGIEAFPVEADSYSSAAWKAACTLQRGQSFGAYRTTGTVGMSGWFQAYMGGKTGAVRNDKLIA